MRPNDTTNDTPYGYCHCGCGQKTKLARQSDTKLGYVKGEPVRFVPGHHVRLRIHRPLSERFWEKVNKNGPNDCWLWTASTDSHGYGTIQVGTGIPAKAPRVSWELHYGPIPAGMLVCHNCPGGDNPLCVNPDHLFLGTHRDNSLDCYAKNKRTPPPGHGRTGEEHPSARFTDDQVRAWRKEYPASGMTMADFARLYDIPRGTMVDILKRRNYRHVT